MNCRCPTALPPSGVGAASPAALLLAARTRRCCTQLPVARWQNGCCSRTGGLAACRCGRCWARPGGGVTAAARNLQAERPGATAATARRSGLPPTDGAAGCRSGTRKHVAIAAAKKSGPLLSSLRWGWPGEPADAAAGWRAGGLPGRAALTATAARRSGEAVFLCRARRSGLTPLLLLPGGAAFHQPTEPPVGRSPVPALLTAAPRRLAAALQLPPAVWGQLCCCCCPAALEWAQPLLAAQRCCSLQGR